MQTETLLKLEKMPYPSGRFADVGENLRTLTRNESAYIPPVRSAKAKPTICPIIVPTNRDIRNNHKNIDRIMRLAQEREVSFVLFLCSGEAKKEDVASIAHRYKGTQWMAVDGPFLHEHHQHDFETTYSPLSYGSERDVSQKRNFALQIARLMGWETLFFLDDDVTISGEQLYKTFDLLHNGGASVVGFSARSFPDHSVVMHAERWTNGPIDSFIGSGAMAIRTNTSVLPFFPHIYNEDWMFLLVYCLFGEGDVVWGGTIEQRAYDPFKNGQRAKIEEPGDMLGESLLRLIMATSADLQGQHDFDTVAKIITKLADERFWEYEINNRISFIVGRIQSTHSMA
ncbi:MAG: hypothetical protein AAB834_02505, partial [Patescibacteria group bacterium]